jgi:hypothetical protein
VPGASRHEPRATRRAPRANTQHPSAKQQATSNNALNAKTSNKTTRQQGNKQRKPQASCCCRWSLEFLAIGSQIIFH